MFENIRVTVKFISIEQKKLLESTIKVNRDKILRNKLYLTQFLP